MATDLLPNQAIATRTPPPKNAAPVNDLSNESANDQELPNVQETSDVAQNSFVSDLVELTKPRIVMMILVTTVATAMIGAGGLVSVSALVWLLLGTAMIAGSAGAANQVWERVIDCNMTRTASRPLPGQRMSTATAIAFTTIIGVAGTAVLWQRFGITPAFAGVATWMLYVLVYTPMKTRTSFNTTVGAIAGALPVLIGYTACGGQISDVTGWLLVGVLVAWQYPHFMAIAWMYRRQYDEAGFKMSTTVEPTGLSAGIQAIVGCAVLLACGIALCFLPGSSITAWIGSALVVVAVYPMLKASIVFFGDRNDQKARKLLLSSLLVLPAVLLIVTLRVFW
ncbi:Protoheme IX farnesyltransferase 1 [Rubripirellula obstinata]|uniref:Protoheme IX farnesyltransferase n=1 Tax=Rubripirellula obstinata TaxID=406547 RepID=A0A5B1CM26_9BACT|nr:heme o synthase [Rubripirellula obstinata]KAA1260394.1 Protoheme IX farnesyltransferase 1 [Rubripirellula obstinata]